MNCFCEGNLVLNESPVYMQLVLDELREQRQSILDEFPAYA